MAELPKVEQEMRMLFSLIAEAELWVDRDLATGSLEKLQSQCVEVGQQVLDKEHLSSRLERVIV